MGTIAALALGVGVNGGLFSLVSALYVREPSGVLAPRSVHRVYSTVDAPNTSTRRNTASAAFSFPAFRAMNAGGAGDVAIVAYAHVDSEPVEAGSQQFSAGVDFVSDDFFRALGVRPVIGRSFTASEDDVAAPTPVAVVSEDFQSRHLNAGGTAVGAIVQVDGTRFTVVGVMPSSFRGVDLGTTRVWLPLGYVIKAHRARTPWYYDSGARPFRLLVRLDQPAGGSPFLARASAQYRAFQLSEGWPDSSAHLVLGSLSAAGGPSATPAEAHAALRINTVALCILLIACANIGALLLARTEARRREFAIRQALGASQTQIVLQVMSEGLQLSLAAGAAAILAASWTGSGIRHLLFPGVDWSAPVLDVRVCAVIVGVSLGIGVFLGIAGLIGARRAESSALMISSRIDDVRRGNWIHAALLAAQACLATVVLVGTGLFVQSLSNVTAIKTGYDARNLVSVAVSYPDGAPAPELIRSAFQNATSRVAALPGVASVAVASSAPMWTSNWISVYAESGDSIPWVNNYPPVLSAVSPEYFRTVGIAIKRGRGFDASDRQGSAPVIVVNTTMAGVLWPHENPIGQCLRLSSRGADCMAVVGVAADVHIDRVIESPRMEYFLPLAQVPQSLGFVPTTIVTQLGPLPPADVAAAIKTSLDASLPTETTLGWRRLSEVVANQVHPWEVDALLLGCLGLVALMVAASGTYSLVTFRLSRRRREMAVRISLGARPGHIASWLLRSGLVSVAAGCLAGVMIAASLGSKVQSELYGVSARSPAILALSVATVVVAAVVASIRPAREALATDPAVVMRVE